MKKRMLAAVARARAICAAAAVRVETARDLIARSRYMRSLSRRPRNYPAEGAPPLDRR
jgi:hypothetical protein